MFWPCETRTSTCRSFATISSGLYRFLAIAVLLDVKDIPQVGPLQWGWIIVLSGRVLMVPGTEGTERSNRFASKLWFHRDPDPISIETETELLMSLDRAPANVRYLPPTDPLVMGFILNPIGYLPPTLPRPAYIYGHLPFDGVTQATDVFYRCEHWLTSRRVLLRTGEILAGTYGFPESELDFVPTGFAAVGRYALPDL